MQIVSGIALVAILKLLLLPCSWLLELSRSLTQPHSFADLPIATATLLKLVLHKQYALSFLAFAMLLSFVAVSHLNDIALIINFESTGTLSINESISLLRKVTFIPSLASASTPNRAVFPESSISYYTLKFCCIQNSLLVSHQVGIVRLMPYLMYCTCSAAVVTVADIIYSYSLGLYDTESFGPPIFWSPRYVAALDILQSSYCTELGTLTGRQLPNYLWFDSELI